VQLADGQHLWGQFYKAILKINIAFLLLQSSFAKLVTTVTCLGCSGRWETNEVVSPSKWFDHNLKLLASFI